MKVKRILNVLAIFSLLTLVPFMMGAVDLSAQNETLKMYDNNPYVRQYLIERGTVADEGSLLNNTAQRAADMEALVEIYNQDVNVGSILQKYLPEIPEAEYYLQSLWHRRSPYWLLPVLWKRHMQ